MQQQDQQPPEMIYAMTLHHNNNRHAYRSIDWRHSCSRRCCLGWTIRQRPIFPTQLGS
ncbi:protein of unknown function [Pseudomonas inefficax]|uniref:Uncharacterized protein n=1 Tax=Pseudomonas inefficax TaxID=2078786 RepID=A0AAQ1SR90_9PSED|nr:protein of unknown function [Pseudomonas inefficax]